MDICENTYETFILIIFCIILITLFISFIILMYNIINYIMFTVYCLSDNANDYTSDAPDTIILGNKYKYRLLNYVKNINDNSPDNNYIDKSVIKEYYDTNSSDLYIHKTIIYYNYLVKLLLFIMLIIVIGILYNIFKIGIMRIGNCDDTAFCGLILTDILTKDTYIYYIIIIIFLYVYAHSYVYTYFFNQNIYKELYDIYGGEDGAAGVAGDDGENKYKTIDTVVSNSINYIINKTEKNDVDSQTNVSLYLTELNNMSFDTLDIAKIVELKTEDPNNSTEAYVPDIIFIMNEGIINNNKFIIPVKYENEGNINSLLKKIYKAPIIEMKDITIKENIEKQKLLGHQIFLYLIYHYTITNSIEDPFIIHKLNNVYLNLFDNLYAKYNSNPTDAKDAKDTKNTGKVDPNDLIERFDPDIKKMFKEIRGAFTIKLLLPVGTGKTKLLFNLNENADLILKYIKVIKEKGGTTPDSVIDKLDNYKDTIKADYVSKDDPLYTLKKTIKDNIDHFAEGFSDFYQDDKTLAVVNRVVYKINFYLAIEMMVTIIYILIVLLLLYKSGKYPYMEKYINIAITYAILIINELVSAILGII